MKIVICPECKQPFCPQLMIPKWCECKKTEAMYKNDVDLLLSDNGCIVIMVSNTDILPLFNNYIGGEELESHVLPYNHPQLIRFKSIK